MPTIAFSRIRVDENGIIILSVNAGSVHHAVSLAQGMTTAIDEPCVLAYDLQDVV